jgi:hypothetical protein
MSPVGLEPTTSELESVKTVYTYVLNRVATIVGRLDLYCSSQDETLMNIAILLEWPGSGTECFTPTDDSPG